jgi:hypothetical protein
MVGQLRDPARLMAIPRAVAVSSQIIDQLISDPNDPNPRNNSSIAVSARNERIIAGVSKVIIGGGLSLPGESRVSYYFSSDGGSTWGAGLIPLETSQKTWSRMADPSIASDADGNFYLCVLVRDNQSFDSGVYIFKSTDDGHTFGDPVPVTFDIGHLTSPKIASKPYVAVDVSPTSPFKNTVYAAWVSTEPDRTVVLTSHRAPGAASFSDSKAISHQGEMHAPSVAIGPGGEFYCAWEGVGNPRVILFNASTDGGETFLPVEAAPSKDFVIHEYAGNLSQPNPAHIINGVSRMNSFPVLGVDRSTGPNRGMIYVTFAETRNNRDSDIFVKQLTPPNGGRPNIGPTIRVNNDSGAADQFFPWLSVDPTNGAVEVAFYDQRDQIDGISVNAYLARSTNGGATFSDNIKVSSEASDPRIQSRILGVNEIGIGDYIGLFATREKAHLLWTDTRNGKQEIRYGRLDFGSSPPPPEPSDSLDECQGARIIDSLPYTDSLDTRPATSSPDDPTSCTGGHDTNTVWYSFTPTVSAVYGIESGSSDYDTVVSVYTGSCGSLAQLACSDDFGNPPNIATRSVLTFSATAGTRYLIVASGKGAGGFLKIRVGYPTITNIRYTTASDLDVFEISGANFFGNNAAVTAQLDGEDIPLPNVFTIGSPQANGMDTILYATKKKLRKLVKKGSLLVRVESPAGSGKISNSFLFTR